MTRDELKELGLEKEVIDKIMDSNGKDIEKAKAEGKSLKEQLEAKDKQIAELGEQIKGFEGNDEAIKTLQGKVAEYEKAEKDRKEAEKQAEADKALTATILDVIGDKKFVNDITKDGIIKQIKDGLADKANTGKGAKEIFESLTKDKEGIFINPQQEKLNIPPTGNGKPNEDDDAFVRQVMGLPPKK